MRLHVDVKTGISITEIKTARITAEDTNSAANPATNKKTVYGQVTASKQTRAALSPKGLS